MPMSDAKDIVKGGLGFGLEYEGYKINDTFMVGAGFFSTSGKGKSDATFGGYTVDFSAVSFTTWGLTPYIKAGKEVELGGKKTNIYGLFGLGFYNSSSNVVGATSSTNIGFNIGGGIMYPLADKMQLGFDLKYHTVSDSGTTWAYLAPAVRFTYSF